MQTSDFPKDEIEVLFYENYNSLDEEAILIMNNNSTSGDINNVVVGLEKHCFGIWVAKDSEEMTYNLFYINGHKKLEGDYIELSLNLKHRDYVTFFFSNFLAHNYEGLDPIDTFNIFQRHLRSLLEKQEYYTVENSTLEKLENPTFFAPHKRGVININFIDRLSLYKDIFGNKQLVQSDNLNVNYVYLMLNKKNNLVKIGKSKKPGFREKTLQSEEPDIQLIIAWEAPSIIERNLHAIFSKKRKRGEWFELKMNDLTIIKNHMTEYAMP